jgi:DNA-binding NtrC family response regulator
LGYDLNGAPRVITFVARSVGGTVAELARRVDMNRSHLQVLLKKHGIRSRDFRGQHPARSETCN